MQNRPKQPVEVKDIPYIPPMVDLPDLAENRKRLSDEQIEAVKADGVLHEGRNGKKQLKEAHPELGELNYGIIKAKNSKGEFNYYAVYKGKKKGKSLGSGAYGSVKLAQDLDTGEWVALKQVRIITAQNRPPRVQMPGTEEEQKEAVQQEIVGLKKAGQLRVESYTKNKQVKGSTLREYEQHETIITLAPGTRLNELNNRQTTLSAIRGLEISFSLLERIKEAHDNNIIHRDIKPENVHYDAATRSVSLVDFGLAAVMEKRGDSLSLAPSKGTPGFMAPEISRGIYSEKTDVYAAGKSIAETLKLTDASGDLRKESEIEKFPGLLKNPAIEKKILAHLSEMANDDPAKRPSIEQSLQFFSQIKREYISVMGLVVKVGYLDVSEYVAASPTNKEAIKKALSGMDEVWLIDEKGKPNTHYATVKKELESAGLLVRNQVVQYLSGEREDVLLCYKEQRGREDNHIYESNRLACKEQQLEWVGPTLLKKGEMDTVTFALNYQAKNLGSFAPKDTRKADISSTKTNITELYQKGQLSYAVLRNELLQLEKKLQSKHVAVRFFQKSGFFLNNQQKEVRRLLKEVESTPSLPKPSRK